MVTIPELSQDAAQLQQRIERFYAVRDGILAQVRQVIVGQEDVLDQILTALFVGGHCLITGLPGTAKTLMVRTIAETLGLTFRRIQFTPDLMPSDITGTDIIEEDLTTGHRKWTFVQGPIFGNILLADEINRTPPKTQAALLRNAPALCAAMFIRCPRPSSCWPPRTRLSSKAPTHYPRRSSIGSSSTPSSTTSARATN
jgi:MoxR-like ATPase